MKNVALIVAGGIGSRMGLDTPKQYIPISGKPIIIHTIEQFLKNPDIDGVKVVIAKGHEEYYYSVIGEMKLLPFSYGGETRQDSVRNGLQDLAKYNPTNVLIHDAARPFLSQDIITECISALKKNKAVDVGITPKDTIKTLSNEVIDRNQLYQTQTPQCFDYKTISSLHEKYIGKNLTDDIALALKDKIEIAFVEGHESNIKITTVDDLKYGEFLMNQKSLPKVGIGYDVHKYQKVEKQTQIRICGVDVMSDYAVIAHSDGDVGLHALMDAMLGTAGLGDIGEHFPPNDEKWRNADSMKLLEHVYDLIKKKGGKVLNIDLVIICEKPRILKYKQQMKERLMHALSLDSESVNIKATTTEKLGFTGREEGIAAQAICSIIY